MAQKSPRYRLYQDFVDAYMKCHHEMTRCDSHHQAQTKWNEIKINEALVKRKITEYLDKWNKAGRPERELSKKSSGKKGGTPKKDSPKRTFSSDDDTQNADPNIVKPPLTKHKASIEVINIDEETSPKDKSKAPAQETILNDLTEISQRIENLIQVKSMGLLTGENQKTLKKLMAQKQERTNDLKRLQARQRASTRYRERRKQRVEQLCVSNPDIAVELAKVSRPTTQRMPIDMDCPDLLKIIGEVARIDGATNNDSEKACLTLDDITDAIQKRGYEIQKTSLYYRLMPKGALSQDGKKHIVTVPVRLRKMQGMKQRSRHEDSHFTAASLKHIKDLAGIFGNDCVFYLTQDTKAKIKIGRPSNKDQSPLIMHLDYEISSVDLQSTASNHQLTPCIYAASIIDETGSITHAGPTYVSIRSAKHDRLTHESHAIDFDRLIKLKGFEKVACDYLGRIKPIVIMSIDTNGSENNTRYSKALASAIDKFKKYNLDALVIVNQAPGQALLNVVERRLSPMSQDLAGLILPHDHFGTHLNANGLVEHAELEKENFKLTGDVLAEVWSMNVLDEYPVVAEYIKPSPMIDEHLKMVDSTLALDNIIDRVCEEEASLDPHVNQIRQVPTMSTMEIKTECDIDEYWCATHVLQTQYTIQIIRCNDPLCCTPWRSNYNRVFPHRFLPPPVPFHRSSRGVKMADIESSSATTNSISPFYGNLFQRIQFHGIVINHTKNDILPFDAFCPSLQTKLSSRLCSVCKQYIPIAIRLRNHYKIHQQYSSIIDYDNNKEENILDDQDLNDPYDMSIIPMNSTQNGVYLFTDILEWLESDFEDDDTIENVKTKSTAAMASAMLRHDRQMTTTTTTAIDQISTQNSLLNALEHLAMMDDGTSSIGNIQSQEILDDIEDLIDAI